VHFLEAAAADVLPVSYSSRNVSSSVDYTRALPTVSFAIVNARDLSATDQ
jgi:hypothetical protein